MQNAKMAAKVVELAKAKGCTAAQLALAWVHHRGDDVVPIPGTLTTLEFCSYCLCHTAVPTSPVLFRARMGLRAESSSSHVA